jgi:cytokinin dehydrogenase
MVTRRGFLAGLGSAAVVFGFDPVSRRWITEAQAAPFDHVPPLDGELVTDPASLAPYANDAGSIVHNTPNAVLRPGSVRDIQRMIRFCRFRHIKVAVRGQGHTTFGQSQVQGGLVIDMATLNTIHSITNSTADVEAGATWKELVQTAFPLGATPRALTGYINLSIGGTLSVGGTPPNDNRGGGQVDRVRELWVVTGRGHLKHCSKHHNRKLFEAVLAGLGQCGVIVRVVMDMVPAPTSARVFLLNYLDNALFFADLRTLLDRGEFDGVYMLGAPDGMGGWVRQINAIKYHNGTPPDPNVILRDLNLPPEAATIQDQSYLEQVLAVDVVIDFFKSIGLWDGVMHPWFDVWLPGDVTESFVADTLAGLTPEDVGPTGFLLLFPQKRSAFTRPLFKLPNQGEYVYLFDILTAAPAPGPDPVFEAQMLARNRTLFEQARDLGGKRYPIGSLDFSHEDWVEHYGGAWRAFKRAKRRYDPGNILGPGPGIF